MAQLGNLLVTGSSRLLGKLFCNDIVGNSLSVKTLNATNFTATSITTSGLTANGNATTTGTLNVGNSQANGKISINGKVAIRDYGYGWLGINDGYTESWSANGIFFGKSIIRTDNAFQLGNNGDKVLFNTSSAKFTVPVTINNSLAANNVTATNVTVNDTLKAFKYELNTIQDLGGEFCVAPTIYIQSGAKVQVNKDSATTIVVSIQDTNAIKSDTIQGVRWAEKSKIKFQGKINGLSIRCNGVMKSKLNTVQNTMSLTLTVDSNIANSFSTSVANATSYSDISVMLCQRYGKKIGSTTENAYSPVGIRMSATGSANAAPYVDIWGSKSSSDPDTIYTVPSVRLGYLDGLTCGGYSCNGYGLYADNVYLNGTIISNSGTIGGFKMDFNSLTNGTWGTDKSVLVCTGTNSAKAVGGSSAISGWCFTAGSKFGVTTSGDLYASNANISGIVTSENGKIGGFTISQYNIKGANVGLGCASGHDHAFWAGASTGSSAPFRVGHDGALTATNATITGTITSDNITATSGSIGSFKLDSTYLQSSDKTVGLSASSADWAFWAGGSTAGTAKFRVTQAGTLYTRDIQATAGKIGKYTITSTYLRTGTGSTCTGIGGIQAFWAGSDSSNGAPFRVSYSGEFVATNATISGDITATSGTIGGCSITDGVLKVASGNIVSVNASNITSGTLSADRIGANSITVGKITTENLVGTNGWINLNKGTFNYGKGALVWDGSNLSMKGKIQATSGNIAGWDILELGFSKNLKQLYSGSDGTYLGLDGIRINDATYGISLNGGLLKFWKSNSFAGGIFPLGYEENKPSSLGFYITEAHSSLRFGTATASTEVLGNISAADTCYVIGDNLDSAGINYKNTFYNGVKIDRLSCNEFCNVYSSGDIDTSTDFYRKGNKLGEYFTDMVTSTTKSLANNTWTNTGAAITLSKGVYAMVGTVVYAAAKSGRRGARFANLSSGYTQTTNVTSATTASQTAYVQCQWIVVVTDDFQDYYLQGYQDTGAVLNVTSSYMRAVRIA